MLHLISQTGNVPGRLHPWRCLFLLIFCFYASYGVTFSRLSELAEHDISGASKCSLVKVQDGCEEPGSCELQIFAGHDSSRGIVTKRKNNLSWSGRNGSSTAISWNVPSLSILRFSAYARCFAYLAELITCDYRFSNFVRAGPAYL